MPLSIINCSTGRTTTFDEPMPAASDRDLRHQWIALYDALDVIGEPVAPCLWEYKHPLAAETARLWAASRDYKCAEEPSPSETTPGYIHRPLTVYRGGRILFTVRLDTPPHAETK